MHDDEIPVDAGLVARLVAGQFPELAGLPVRRLRSTGTVNAIFRVGDHHCARMPLTSDWASDLDRELAWLPTLAPHLPLPVPRPVGRGHPTGSYPHDWALFDWIDGQPYPASLVDESAAAITLAGFVTALRGIPIMGGEPPAGREPLADLDDDTRRALHEAGDLGLLDEGAALDAWDRALEAPTFWGDGEPAVWIHADLLPGNVLVHGGRLAAVIDFGSVGVGDPAADVIAAWTMFDRPARALYRARLGVDDGTWARARGYALTQAAMIMPYYVTTNPQFCAMAGRSIAAVVADTT
ncbi:MAG: aminoglycoside phosphotransferase family protein [Humibacillus sp.]|nr:aminoglycoside phosphotransferase family protein [Humibacillus sp.]MDN5776616.1 aminoglycoside phosphotransferase family protein [Humibacillus sp.]